MGLTEIQHVVQDCADVKQIMIMICLKPISQLIASVVTPVTVLLWYKHDYLAQYFSVET